MSARYTMRRDGREHTTILVEAHPERELVEWIMEALGVSERRALHEIRERAAWFFDDWATFGVAPDDPGKLQHVPTDDIDAYADDGWKVYGA